MDQLAFDAVLNNIIATTMDSSGTIIFASDGFCRLSGYPRETLIGANISIIQTEHHDRTHHDFIWKTIKNGHTWKGECKNKNKHGEFFWVDLSIIPITHSVTGEAQYISIYNDISQQKSLIKTLQQRSQRQGIMSILGQLANNTNQSQLFIEQAIATLTATLNMDMGIILNIKQNNKASIIATTEAEVQKIKTEIDLSQQHMLWGYTYHVKSETYFNDISKETNFILPEILSDFNFSSGISIIFGDSKEPYGILSLFKSSTQDITYDDIFFVKTVANLIYDAITRIEIKQALIKEKEITEKYLNVADVMILILDTKGNISLANKKTSELLGLNQKELTGLNWIDNFIPESRQKDEKNYYQILLNNKRENKNHSESIIYDKNKKRRHIKWHHSLLTDSDKNTIGIISAGEDITELLNAEKKQRQLQKELYQAQKMEAIGMITGGITHDFNNILASILGFSNLALERFTEDKNSKLSIYLNEIDKAGRKARDIITQIQNFNQNQTSSIKAENISPLVKSILVMLRSAIPSSMQFEQYIDNDLPPAIIQADQFNQVIMHLLINARNATHNKGKITLSVHEQNHLSAQCSSCHKNFSGHFIEVNISDNGHGLTEDQITEIFDDAESNSTGLSVVHRIMHQSNAHMLLESTLGKGTKVRLFFEVANHHNQSQVPNIITKMPEANTHFMIVDDENSVASFLGEFINTIGCISSVFTDPTLALKAFKTNPDDYDIVITDQTMPSLCGDDLIREIRQFNTEIPVILCTGNKDHINDDIKQELNIQSFLHKPFEKQDLLSTISQLLDD